MAVAGRRSAGAFYYLATAVGHPFLFRNVKRHGAVIGDGGRSSRYDMPLLGTPWVAEYEVSGEGREIRGRLRSPWAEASEQMRKQ